MNDWLNRQETRVILQYYGYLYQVSQFRTLTTAEDNFRNAIEAEITDRVTNDIAG
jgi:hypothetical protein